ncbi:hypothetical protein GWR21_17165 [Chitinophaga agri]|uniref:Uncharacterized protein n=1 Tax=Chitinophaga agri TaxID=2703787 RepID=A0A6B9ZIS2_9BACT|nr:hypothetical protein GWR21_17165 [Chitinophaga agri]
MTADDVVDLSDAKKLLAYNGFENTLRGGLPFYTAFQDQ